MLPDLRGRKTEIDVERPELAKPRTHLVETHLVNDLLERIDLVGDERHAPFPIIQPGRARDELRDTPGKFPTDAGVTAHELFPRGEIEGIPVVRAAAAFVH